MQNLTISNCLGLRNRRSMNLYRDYILCGFGGYRGSGIPRHPPSIDRLATNAAEALAGSGRCSVIVCY